jgi:hypothetical protein
VYYHVIQLYSSLIRNLQQKEEIFYGCEEDEYSDICKSLAKLASFLRVQYKSGRGFLIRVIEGAKPSRHAKISAELIKTGDHPNAIEYREKRMARMTVAVNLREDEDYELLQGMFVDSANESIYHQAAIEEDRAEYNLNGRSSGRSASGNGCNKDRERSVKEMRIHNQDVETIAAVEVSGSKMYGLRKVKLIMPIKRASQSISQNASNVAHPTSLRPTISNFVVRMTGLKAWRSNGLPLSNELCSPLPLK